MFKFKPFDIIKVLHIQHYGHIGIIVDCNNSKLQGEGSYSIKYLDGHKGMVAWFTNKELEFVSRPIDYAETPEEWHQIQFNKKADDLINN